MHSLRILSLVAASVVVTGAAVAISCKRADDTGAVNNGPDAKGFDKAALLRAFGECTLGTYRDVQTKVTALDAAVKAAEADPTKLPAARAAWKDAMLVWSRADLFSYGPAGKSGSNGTPGGQDLRDAVYSYPLLSRCLVDQKITTQDYDKPAFASDLVSVRSLAAVEYLLFYDGPDNGCPPENAINAMGTWKALGDGELAKRRAAYARAATDDVVANLAKLVDAWTPGKGGFQDVVGNAGKNDVYPSQQVAFNAISDAIFYIDLDVKNQKVGRAAGLTLGPGNVPDCSTPPCLDVIEAPYAHVSKDLIRQNLAGFELGMKGCGANNEGLGFDDYLVAVGAEATAKKLLDGIGATRGALDALGTTSTFEDDLKTNPAGVKALFDAMRGLVGTMKTEFVTVLDLELPRTVQGDND